MFKNLRRSISIVHLCAFAVITVSAVANIRYGLTLGSTGFEKTLYAMMSGASDGFKAFCLPLLLAAIVSRNYLRVVAIIFLLPLVVVYSWVSAIGFAATSSEQAIGIRQHIIQQTNQLNQSIAQATDKLGKLAQYPDSRPKKFIEAELLNPPGIDQVVWKRTNKCTDVTLPKSIAECKKFQDLKLEHIIANERMRLEKLIRSNTQELKGLGPLQAMSGDPGAENIQIYLAALGFNGLDTPQIRAWLSFLIMGLLEVGSLTGLLIADGMKERNRSSKSRSIVHEKSIPGPVLVPVRSLLKNGTPNGTEQKALKGLKRAGGFLHGTQLELCKLMGISSKTTLHRTLHKLAERGSISLNPILGFLIYVSSALLGGYDEPKIFS